MTIEEYIEERRKRVANMTLAQARDLIAKTLSHSDMEMEFDKAVQMLLDCAEEKINSGWTPVSEGFPKEYNTYEVTLRGIGELEGIDNEVAYATWFGNKNNWKNNWIYHGVDNWKDKEVIAWKPLSQPYKTESEVEE